ncbi:MAG TPA: MATE family efflux transporter [Myxococcaceae bacterium]|nr:MATE family efflux transporter [Myxococcaceae bacterium]
MSATLPAPVPAVSLRTLFKLAWPIIISRSTQVVIGLGDALMVSHLGETGLAATTTGAFNTFAVLILPMGMVFIVSSFASQLYGSGDAVGARRYGFYGLGVAALTQLICTAVIPVLPMLLAPLNYTPEVRTLIYEYLWLRLLSGGAAIGIEALANFYGGLGNTRLPMLVNVLAMGLDLVGNWMLIGGHWGAPAMGVAGAALSSTLSCWLLFLFFAAVFFRDGRRPENGGRRIPLGLKLSEFRRMMRFGLPSGFNWFFEFFAFNLFINTVLAGLGTTALAAFMAVMQINSVAFMPAFAISSAGAILVGQSIGSGRKDDVPPIVRLTWGAAAGWQGLASAAYLAIPTLLLEPFANAPTRAGGFLVVGARMLRLSVAWQLFDATVSALSESLRAAGDTAFTMWSRIGLAWLFFMPGAWITVRVLGYGDVGAVLWVVLYLGALAGVLWLRFRSNAWRNIQLVDAAPLP